MKNKKYIIKKSNILKKTQQIKNKKNKTKLPHTENNKRWQECGEIGTFMYS